VIALLALLPGKGAACGALIAGAACLGPEVRGDRAWQGARVSTDSLFSQALGTRKRFVVWLPPSYDREPARRYPVVYLLHGHSGNEWNWVRSGHVDRTLDSLVAAGMPELIVVMPDGDDGWYTTWNALLDISRCRADSTRAEPAETYCVAWTKYDDYLARDVVARVDSAYRTIPTRAARGIAGLSMGGYGAVSLALLYPDVYAAAASHSGVLAPLVGHVAPHAGNPLHARDAADLQRRTGPLWRTMGPAFGRDTTGWWARTPARLLERLAARDRGAIPALWIDVGTADPFLAQSRDFRATLTRLGVPHEYRENPGAHDWPYWRRHVAGSLPWLAARLARGA
jgi:putative tributyrin esterase